MPRTIIIAILAWSYISGFAQSAMNPKYRTLSGYEVPIMLNDRRGILGGDDTRGSSDKSPNLVIDSVSSFAPYFDDRQIDSFWREFKNLTQKSEPVPGSIIPPTKLMKGYLSLFKMVYGDSFVLSHISRSVMTDTIKHTRQAEIVCKARSVRSRGYLDLVFNVGKDSSISLEKMDFTQFDHIQNDFVANLCQNEWTTIKEKQFPVLIDTIMKYANEPAKINRPVLEKQLNALDPPAFLLFTSRLYIYQENLYVIGIFDADKANKRLLLCYKLLNRKFRPVMVEVLKGNG